MINILTLKDSKKKSSRSKADLFELLLTLKLRKNYKLNTEFLEQEIIGLRESVLKFFNGDSRVEEQDKRANILLPFLIKEIDAKLIPKFGKPIGIIWVGREWQTKQSLSDIDIDFKSGHGVGFSIKSTRSGKGTQKNLGIESLKKYLDLDIENELGSMWGKIRLDLAAEGRELKEISQEGTTIIRKNKYRFPLIQEIGKKYGLVVQKIAIKRSVENFNKFSPKRKMDFIEYILGLKEIKPLINTGVEGNKPYLYWNEKFNRILEQKLNAKTVDGKGYYIMAGEKPIIRIQANFTNGIGLSAFCERAFLLENII